MASTKKPTAGGAPQPPTRARPPQRSTEEGAYVVRVFRSDKGFTGEVRDLQPMGWGNPLLTTRAYRTERAAWSATTRAFTKLIVG